MQLRSSSQALTQIYEVFYLKLRFWPQFRINNTQSLPAIVHAIETIQNCQPPEQPRTGLTESRPSLHFSRTCKADELGPKAPGCFLEDATFGRFCPERDDIEFRHSGRSQAMLIVTLAHYIPATSAPARTPSERSGGLA
jgi:hypothetical protein